MGCPENNCKPEDIMAAASAPCGQFMNGDKQGAQQGLCLTMAYQDSD